MTEFELKDYDHRFNLRLARRRIRKGKKMFIAWIAIWVVILGTMATGG